MADSEEWSAERRSRLVMRVLSGELTLEEAAEQNALDPATLEQWRETFIAGGRGAVAREQPRAPAASRARFPVGKALIGAGALLLLLLLVAAGVWFVRRPRPSEAQKRCDQAAVAALLKLKRPMTITAYTSAGLPDLDEAGASLDRLLHAWASQSQGRLVYRRVIVKTPEQRAEAKDRGLQEAAFGSPSAAGAMLSTGYFGLAFSYGNENGVIPQLSPNGLDGVEFWIANKIRELRAKADEEHIGVAVLDGAGEIGLDARDLIARNAGVSTGPSIKSILNQSFPFYTIDKAPASASLDGLRNAEVLFVTQPDRDLTDDELRLVDAFLMLGDKTVVFWTSAANVAPGDARMVAHLGRHHIDKLLAGYGIELRRDIVLDPAHPMKLPVVTATGSTSTIVEPAVLLVDNDPKAKDAEQPLDATFPGFFRLDELALPFSSTLVLHPDKQPAARLRAVARSSAQATVIEDDSVAFAPGTTLSGKGPPAERVLAAELTGTIKSAFGDEQTAGRVLVVASSQFGVNPFARAGNAPGDAAGGDPILQTIAGAYAQHYLTATILATKDALDWGSSDSGIVACAALIQPKKK